ncbi:MAG: radical SAM protein, partial [Deltaproteobacteria bacterium]|nr:radical SAM protein [Deltaproteobacteria bacterium]
SLLELVTAIEMDKDTTLIPGVIKTYPGKDIDFVPRKYSEADLLEDMAPRYDLVKNYRNNYYLPGLGIQMGFVVTAYGCPYGCSFCSIRGQTGGRYITHSVDSVMRDIRLLGDIPFIRLVDANTFGNPEHSKLICNKILEAGIKKNFLADVRADTIVRDTEIIKAWKEAGLRAVIVGFEEINESRFSKMDKKSDLAKNIEAIQILKGLGISIVGDFIVDPDYDEKEFDNLGRFVNDNRIDLPMFTILTPIPGTPLYSKFKDKIIIDDLDYYTLTNAVIPTRLEEDAFYENFSQLISAGHQAAAI